MFPERGTEPPWGSGGRLGPLLAYAIALLVTTLAVVSQYFVPQSVPAVRPLYSSFLGGLFIVYGIPILAFTFLVGTRPIRRFFVRSRDSAAPALAWYGSLSLLAFLVMFLLVLVYLALDPAALRLLERVNPVLREAQSNPWLWVAFSFVVGAVEETIFRGWIFGYWLARGTSHSLLHAIWTSALFAGVHLYYGFTYGVAAPLVYTELFFLGLAFSLAVRASGGNLVWVAVLHGANDATAFLSILSQEASLALHYGLIFAGAAIALALYVRSRTPPRPGWIFPSSTGEGPGPGGTQSVTHWAPPTWAPPAIPVVPPPAPPPPGGPDRRP